MLAVAMGCWYGERHANIPVFRGCFSHERHVSGEPVVPEPGIPIIRGWRTSEPVAVVLFQIDNARRCRVLYERPPDATLGLRAVKDRVLAVSNTLFQDFTLHDYGEEEPGRREDLVPVTQILQPEIMLRTRVFGAQEKLDHARDWLGRFVYAKPAVQN